MRKASAYAGELKSYLTSGLEVTLLVVKLFSRGLRYERYREKGNITGAWTYNSSLQGDTTAAGQSWIIKYCREAKQKGRFCSCSWALRMLCNDFCQMKLQLYSLQRPLFPTLALTFIHSRYNVSYYDINFL